MGRKTRRERAGATLFYDEIEAARRRTKAMLLGIWVVLGGVWLGAEVVFGAFYTFEECAPDCLNPNNTSEVVGWRWNTAAVILCFVVPTLYMLCSWLWSSRAALFITGAKTPTPSIEAERAAAVLARVSIAAGIVPPQLWVIEDDAPNAFATGRNENNAHVAVTTGLLRLLDEDELEGVMAHEVAHIVNRDVQVTTVAVLAAGVVTTLAEVCRWAGVNAPRARTKLAVPFGALMLLCGVVLYVLAVPAALLLRAGISRSRETLADATAVEITRNPHGLRCALERLEADDAVVRRAVSATGHLWIESPTDRSEGSSGFLGRLLDTHPPLSERIETLKRMEGVF